MKHLYLTRRNLQTLLNKLDRNKNAEASVSACTIIKKDMEHPVYPLEEVFVVQAIEGDEVEVTPLENEDYYTDRQAGDVHQNDVPVA